MTDQVVGKMTVEVEAKVNQESFKQAEAQVKNAGNDAANQVKDFANSINESFNQLGFSIASAVKKGFAVFGVTLGLDYLKNFTEGMMNTGAQVGYLAQKLNISVESLSAFHQIMQQMGGTSAGFDASINNLAVNLAKGTLGMNPQFFGLLSSLGINPRDSTGKVKSADELELEELIKVQSIKDPSKKLAFQQMLGFSTGEINLTNSNKNIREWYEEQKRNAVLTAQQAKNDEEALARWNATKQQWTKIGNDIEQRLIPVLQNLGNAITPVVNLLDKVVKALSPLLNLTSSATSSAANVISAGVDALTGNTTEAKKDLQNVTKSTPVIEQSLKDIFVTPFQNLFNKMGWSDAIKKELASVQNAVAMVESTGGKHLDSGNGAYGIYGTRPYWLARSMGYSIKDAKNPELQKELADKLVHSADFDKYAFNLMLGQDLQTAHGDLQKALTIYGGKNSYPAAVAHYMNTNTKTMHTNNTNNQHINISGVTVKANNSDDFIESMVNKANNPAWSFSNGRLA